MVEDSVLIVLPGLFFLPVILEPADPAVKLRQDLILQIPIHSEGGAAGGAVIMGRGADPSAGRAGKASVDQLDLLIELDDLGWRTGGGSLRPGIIRMLKHRSASIRIGV